MSRLKKSKELKVSKPIREDYEKEESRESGVLLRVDTKFLHTRNLIARRIIGNTPQAHSPCLRGGSPGQPMPSIAGHHPFAPQHFCETCRRAVS